MQFDRGGGARKAVEDRIALALEAAARFQPLALQTRHPGGEIAELVAIAPEGARGARGGACRPARRVRRLSHAL